jgi:hypothetical protein
MNDKRIWSRPEFPKKGTTTQIGYRGILTEHGADKVYLHYGTDGWKSPKTVPMQIRFDGSFVTDIVCNAEKSIDFCFKDSADHWDNNSGMNWMLPIVRK